MVDFIKDSFRAIFWNVITHNSYESGFEYGKFILCPEIKIISKEKRCNSQIQCKPSSNRAQACLCIEFQCDEGQLTQPIVSVTEKMKWLYTFRRNQLNTTSQKRENTQKSTHIHTIPYKPNRYCGWPEFFLEKNLGIWFYVDFIQINCDKYAFRIVRLRI